MFAKRGRAAALSLLLLFAVVGTGSTSATSAFAQVQQGATMTVLRGQVAVIHGDGSALQPAPSGTLVNIGDELRTVGKAGALVTFFAGTEVEMGEDTILVVDGIEKNGDKINISLRQVLGTSLHRVQTIGGSDSLYRVEAGGAVALVRGTTFAVFGPYPSPAGNLVMIVCLDDCDGSSTFAECVMLPQTALGVVVEKGKVLSGCEHFGAKLADGYFGAGDQALTSMAQMLGGPEGDDDDDDDDSPNGSPEQEEEDDDCYGD
jgi:hypothetical protein